MSEAEAYTGWLVPAIPTGFEISAVAGIDPATEFELKAQAVIDAVSVELSKIDWDNNELPPMVGRINGDPVLMEPHQYAEHLITEAFHDTIELTDMCVMSVQETVSPARWLMRRYSAGKTEAHPLADRLDMQELLINSKQTVLNKVLGLTDTDKAHLYAFVKDPSLSRMLLGAQLNGAPLQLEYDEFGEWPLKFSWSKQVSEWASMNTDPSRGCPARNFLIDTPDGKQPITHYLWDQLIRMRFAVRQTTNGTTAIATRTLLPTVGQ